MTAPAGEDQAEALAYLSRTAEYAGDVAKGTRVLVRVDSAPSALAVLRGYMAPEVLAELGELIAWEITARERMA